MYFGGESSEQQRYRASGLNLVMAVVVLWTTVWPRMPCGSTASPFDDSLVQYLSPAGLGAHQPDW